MPTVDDLVISLRIDDTSNLGKLQKQLEALVGPKGGKGVLGLGVSPALKKDLDEIKSRLIRLTPTVLVEGNLKEAAFNLASDLKKDTHLRSALLERYDITTDKFDGFVEELFNITLGMSELNSDQKKSFITEMDKFRKIATMTRGDRKTLITKLTKLMQEASFHVKMVESFRKAGLRVVSKPSVFEVTKKQLQESGTDWKEIIEGYQTKYGDKFDDIKAIFDENSDTLEATGDAVYKATGEVYDITNLTASQIQKSDDLMMVLVAQVASSLERTQWVLGEFYEAGKVMFTGGKKYRSGMAWLDTVVHKFSPEAIKQLGLQKVGGMDLDFAMRNILTEYKSAATLGNVREEARKRLIEQGYSNLILIASEFSQQAIDKIDELLATEEYRGKTITLLRADPRKTQRILGIAPSLDELQKKSLQSLEATKEAIEMSKLTDEERKSDMEGLEEFLVGADEFDDFGTDIKGDVDKLVEKTEKGFMDSAKKLMDIEGKEDEILKRMKEKTDRLTDVKSEEDDTGDNK